MQPAEEFQALVRADAREAAECSLRYKFEAPYQHPHFTRSTPGGRESRRVPSAFRSRPSRPVVWGVQPVPQRNAARFPGAKNSVFSELVWASIFVSSGRSALAAFDLLGGRDDRGAEDRGVGRRDRLATVVQPFARALRSSVYLNLRFAPGEY